MKYNSLESLRGIAALIVILSHSPFIIGEKYPVIAQGRIFVDFFFILSGFVIAYAYQNKIQMGLTFKKFTLLRFGRLYPLHLFMLLAWLPYILAKGYLYHNMGIGSTDPFEHNSVGAFASNFFLVNALNIHDNLSWNYPAWSISVEFFTYLIFFLFISVFKQSYKPVFSLMISIAAYLSLYAIYDDTLLREYDLSIVRCMGGFFLGVFVYSLPKVRTDYLNTWVSSILEISTIVLMLYLTLYILDSKAFQLATFVVFGGMVYLFSAQKKGLISILLNTTPMIFLGTISYSIYMTHALVLAIIRNIWQYVLNIPPNKFVERDGLNPIAYFDTPMADVVNIIYLLTVIGVSYFTYSYIEKPWRNKFRAWSDKDNKNLQPLPIKTN